MTVATHFEQLLRTATAQPEPQRLLFVFAEAELPEGATAGERERFEAGLGGALTPLACVDKAPAELTTFDALLRESHQACPPWQVLFIAALAGQDGRPPSSALVDSSLNAMVESVRAGRLAGYMALSSRGEPLMLEPAAAGGALVT